MASSSSTSLTGHAQLQSVFLFIPFVTFQSSRFNVEMMSVTLTTNKKSSTDEIQRNFHCSTGAVLYFIWRDSCLRALNYLQPYIVKTVSCTHRASLYLHAEQLQVFVALLYLGNDTSKLRQHLALKKLPPFKEINDETLTLSRAQTAA